MARKFLGGKPTVGTTDVPVVIESRTITTSGALKIAGGTSADLSADRALTVDPASTSAAGVVQLSDSTSTNASTKAATEKAVYDTKLVADAAIAKSLITTIGDLIIGAGSPAVPTRLAVGATNGHVLTADSTATNGVAWASLFGANYQTPVQYGATVNAQASSRSITLGATPTSGNLLILVSNCESTNSVSSITQTNVSWSKLTGTTAGSAPVTEIWVGTISASASKTLTHTFSGAGAAASQYGSIAVIEVTGITGTLDTTATRTDLFWPSLTPGSTAKILVLGLTQDTFGSYFGAWNGFGAIQFPGATTGAYFAFPKSHPVVGSAGRTNATTGNVKSILASII